MKIELQNITATAEGLFEYDSGKVLIHIPKDEINKLSFGFVAPIRWPIIAFISGIALIPLAIYFGLIPFITEAIIEHSNDRARNNLLAFFSLHIFTGMYFLRLGLRKKYCLIVETNKGTKKLAFSKPIEEQKSAEFINKMTQQFEYPI